MIRNRVEKPHEKKSHYGKKEENKYKNWGVGIGGGVGGGRSMTSQDLVFSQRCCWKLSSGLCTVSPVNSGVSKYRDVFFRLEQ
jgi:hypothetical protein